MIDCEKLQICLDLADKYYETTGNEIVLELNYSVGCRTYPHQLFLKNEIVGHYFFLDELINKLREIMKPQPKFQTGQKVWYIHPITNKPVEDEILGIKVKPNDEIQYQFAHYAMMECDVYASEDDIPRTYKYKIRDVVWRVDDENLPLDIYIHDIDKEADTEVYFDGVHWWSEEQLYPTRETLIKSQIEHWHSLLNPEIDEIAGELKLVSEVGKCPDCGSDMADYWGKRDDGSWWTGCSKGCGHLVQIKEKDKCEHESDGYSYASDPIQYKCKKCGEVYR